MKHFVSILMAAMLLLGVAAFAGCDQTPVDTGTSDITIDLPSDYSASITLGVMNDPGEISNAEKFIESFNEKYPKISVQIEPISGSYAEYILNNAAAGLIPDVFWVGDDSVTRFAENDLLLNLDDVIAADDEFDINAYYPAMVKLGQLDHNGSQYMLPRDYNKITVIYNKDLFDQAGVAYPEDDWTYDEFVDICLELREAFDKSGLQNTYPVDAMLNWPPSYTAFFAGFGATTIQNGEVKFDSEEGIEAIEAMKYLVDERLAFNPYNASIGNLFLSNRIAMWFSVRTIVSQCVAANLNFDFAAFPAFENPSVGAGTSGYGIYSGTSDKSASWALLKHMMSEEGQEAFSQTGNAVPSLMAMNEAENASWKMYPSKNYNHDAFVANPERDVVVTELEGLPSEIHADISGGMLDLLSKAFLPDTYPDEFKSAYPNASDQTLANWVVFKKGQLEEIIQDV